MNNGPVLVVGGTGALGGQVVDALLARGKQVRALVRPRSDASRLEAAGVEIARGDMMDPDSLVACHDRRRRRGHDGGRLHPRTARARSRHRHRRQRQPRRRRCHRPGSGGSCSPASSPATRPRGPALLAQEARRGQARGIRRPVRGAAAGRVPRSGHPVRRGPVREAPPDVVRVAAAPADVRPDRRPRRLPRRRRRRRRGRRRAHRHRLGPPGRHAGHRRHREPAAGRADHGPHRPGARHPHAPARCSAPSSRWSRTWRRCSTGSVPVATSPTRPARGRSSAPCRPPRRPSPGSPRASDTRSRGRTLEAEVQDDRSLPGPRRAVRRHPVVRASAQPPRGGCGCVRQGRVRGAGPVMPPAAPQRSTGRQPSTRTSPAQERQSVPAASDRCQIGSTTSRTTAGTAVRPVSEACQTHPCSTSTSSPFGTATPSPSTTSP